MPYATPSETVELTTAPDEFGRRGRRKPPAPSLVRMSVFHFAYAAAASAGLAAAGGMQFPAPGMTTEGAVPPVPAVPVVTPPVPALPPPAPEPAAAPPVALPPVPDVFPLPLAPAIPVAPVPPAPATDPTVPAAAPLPAVLPPLPASDPVPPVAPDPPFPAAPLSPGRSGAVHAPAAMAATQAKR